MYAQLIWLGMLGWAINALLERSAPAGRASTRAGQTFEAASQIIMAGRCGVCRGVAADLQGWRTARSFRRFSSRRHRARWASCGFRSRPASVGPLGATTLRMFYGSASVAVGMVMGAAIGSSRASARIPVAAAGIHGGRCPRRPSFRPPSFLRPLGEDGDVVIAFGAIWPVCSRGARLRQCGAAAAGALGIAEALEVEYMVKVAIPSAMPTSRRRAGEPGHCAHPRCITEMQASQPGLGQETPARAAQLRSPELYAAGDTRTARFAINRH